MINYGDFRSCNFQEQTLNVINLLVIERTEKHGLSFNNLLQMAATVFLVMIVFVIAVSIAKNRKLIKKAMSAGTL